MPFQPNNGSPTWETAQVAIADGLDVQTTGRAVAPGKLLVAENVVFRHRVGLEKRRGHVSTRLRSGFPVPGPRSTATESDVVTLDLEPAAAPVSLPTDGSFVFGALAGSPHDVGVLAGVTSRDQEVLGWTGWELRGLAGDTYAPGGVSAVAPAIRTRPISKAPAAQKHEDLGDNGTVHLVAWWTNADPALGTNVWYSVYDSKTAAPYVVNQKLYSSDPASVQGVKVVPAGAWLHVVVHRSGTVAEVLSVHESDPAAAPALTWTATDALSAQTNVDAHRLTDTEWTLSWGTAADDVRFTKCDQAAPRSTIGTVLVNDTGLRAHSHAVHPVTGDVIVVWVNAVGDVTYEVFGPTGVSLSAAVVLDPASSAVHVGVAPRWSLNGSAGVWDVFWDTGVSGHLKCAPGTEAGSAGTVVTDTRAVLAGSPFRVGDRVFAPVTHDSLTGATLLTYQDSWFLVDTALKPVARLEYGTARVTAGDIYLPSWHHSTGEDTVNPRRFHGSLVYKTRIDSPNDDQFDEESIKRADLQILPPLRTAQFGGSVYVAGGQLQAYDGAAFGEAQHLLFPEMFTAPVSANTGGGAMVAGQVYRYRVYLVRKTAQGEEVFSAAVTTDAVTVGGGHNSVVLTLSTSGLTRYEDAYFLVYRNETSGTVWNLVSPRDPSLAPRYDRAHDSVTYTDKSATAANIAHELDPANSGVLANFAGPASEVVAQGRDRLWLAGGEIAPGTILPSLQRGLGQVASFNGFLDTTITSGADQVTGFAFTGVSTLVFEARRTLAMEADGPDNFGNGGFDTPRVVQGIGASAPEGTLVTGDGVYFQSQAGPKLLALNYQLLDVGEPVRFLAADSRIVGALEVQRDRQVRFYRADGGALVLDTGTGTWVTWPGTECVGVTAGPGTNLAVLGKARGDFWTETEGTWTDEGRGFVSRFRTAWFGGPGEAFQLLRRVALNGDNLDTHVLHCRLYFDDSEDPVDTWSWNPAADLNVSEWGDGAWGDNFWGDPLDTDEYRPYTYSTKRRVAHQRCARFSLEVRDDGPTTAGFTATALTFEIGRRPGINRFRERTNTTE